MSNSIMTDEDRVIAALTMPEVFDSYDQYLRYLPVLVLSNVYSIVRCTEGVDNVSVTLALEIDFDSYCRDGHSRYGNNALVHFPCVDPDANPRKYARTFMFSRRDTALTNVFYTIRNIMQS